MEQNHHPSTQERKLLDNDSLSKFGKSNEASVLIGKKAQEDKMLLISLMKMTPNKFQSNKPEKDMICTDPTGKKYELHKFQSGFGFNCCANCGLDNPNPRIFSNQVVVTPPFNRINESRENQNKFTNINHNGITDQFFAQKLIEIVTPDYFSKKVLLK